MASFKPHTLIMGLSLSLLMGGCMVAQPLTSEEKQIQSDLDVSNYYPATREMRANITTQPLFTQAAFWGREYDLNPSDLESAINLSAAVRKLGNPQRAIEISQTTRALYPRDPYLAAEYAAALIASERALDAIKPLDGALSVAPNYARLWSLKGAALDQTEQYELARRHYNRALQITPNDPNILANLGLSYALAGDPVAAEGWLRRAAALPGAGSGVHQNLGLVLQLQGKTAEAQKLARLTRGDQKLPPPPVPAHNVTQPSAAPQNLRSPQGQSYVPQTQRGQAPNLRGTYNPQGVQSQYRAPNQYGAQSQSQRQPQRQARRQSQRQAQGYASASDAARKASAQRQQNPAAQVKPLPTAGELTAEQRTLLNQISGNLNPQNGQAPRQISGQASGQAQYPTQNAPSGYPAQTYAPQYQGYGQTREPARRRR